jgi:hypothetical protein
MTGSSRLFRLETGVGGIGVPNTSGLGLLGRKKHLQLSSLPSTCLLGAPPIVRYGTAVFVLPEYCLWFVAGACILFAARFQRRVLRVDAAVCTSLRCGLEDSECCCSGATRRAMRSNVLTRCACCRCVLVVNDVLPTKDSA